MFRNLMSMDVEEMVRAQPMDAVVLIGGCDKTVPALLMGALSADKPAILVVTGPMMTSRHGDERLGACTDCRRFWAQYRAGTIDAAEIAAVESRLATTAGTCMVMGTASTMACLAEALGMILPGTAAIPAVHADRLRAAEASGARAVAMAKDGAPRPSEIVTADAVDNALRVLLALGGSTNGILHLAAIAGRAGIAVDLERFNALSEETPVLVDLKPTGPHYMEDLFNAGGLGAVLRELKPQLHLQTRNVAGQSLAERLAADPPYVDRGVVRPFEEPVSQARRPRRAVRQPRARRRDPEALGGGRPPVRARGPGGRVPEPRGPLGADRRPGPRRHARTTCWCCRTPARRAARACPRRATCRSRASSRAAA